MHFVINVILDPWGHLVLITDQHGLVIFSQEIPASPDTKVLVEGIKIGISTVIPSADITVVEKKF